MTEAAVAAEIMRGLAALAKQEPQTFFWRAPSSPYGRSGVADILGVYRGRAVAIEVKRPGGTHPVTANQKEFLASFKAAGGIALVARSWADVVASLR